MSYPLSMDVLAEFLLARIPATDEASRRIVEECHHVIRSHFSDDFTADYLAETVLKLLALQFRGDADYRQEWEV